MLSTYVPQRDLDAKKRLASVNYGNLVIAEPVQLKTNVFAWKCCFINFSCNMFKLVDIQESFPSLNDIDGFTKLFKKSPSAFAGLVHFPFIFVGNMTSIKDRSSIR